MIDQGHAGEELWGESLIKKNKNTPVSDILI